jgi:ubiquinone/menaquinone biosynthesis C-methylase UbiE
MEQAGLLAEYYAKRAPEYERIYQKPERQGDLAELRELARETFAGKDVLEVACGTGYWTEVLAGAARSVRAMDVNEEVLEIARSKAGNRSVQFEIGDAYSLAGPKRFSGALAAFWWSHVPKKRIAEFLEGLHRTLERNATVMFMDNCYVEGSSTPLNRTDAEGNTYQARKLDDGSPYEVLKNFPTEAELREAVADVAESAEVRFLEYYWVLSYRVGR